MKHAAKRLLSACLALLLVVGLVPAALAAEPGVLTEAGKTVTNVNISAPNGDAMEVGQTLRLAAQVQPDDTGNPVTWDSDSPGIASVDNNGVVTGRSKGKAQITAQCGGVTSNPITVTVTGPESVPVTGVRLNQHELALNAGESTSLNASVEPRDAADQTVIWSSDNEQVAQVRDGRVTAVKAGVAFITVTTRDGGKTDRCQVTVRDAQQAGVTVSPKSQTLAPGQTITLSAVTVPQGQEVTWSTSDSSVAEVDPSTGRVTAKTPARQSTAVITATFNYNGTNYRDTCTVTVTPASVPTLPQSAAVRVGQSVNLTVSGLPAGATVSWSGGNAALRLSGSSGSTVTATGGRLSGKSTVVAVTADVSYGGQRTRLTCQVTVNPGSVQDITYKNTQAGGEQALRQQDFQSVCRAVYGYDLKSVTFRKVSGGELFYNGKALSLSTSTFDTAELNRVSIQVASGSSGAVTVNYDAVDTDSNRYSGTVKLTLSAAGSVIKYAAPTGGAALFNRNDFQSTCRNAVGGTLDFVTFSRPASSKGTLYCDFNSRTGEGTALRDKDACYYSPSRRQIDLDTVAFVPDRKFEGTVSIPFTGRNTSGKTFSGSVELTVGTAGKGDVTYKVPVNGSVALDDRDFNDLCRDTAGGTLDYIRFNDLPSSAKGTLYHQYNKSGQREATRNTKYCRSAAPYLDELTFVPAKDYEGTVSLSFTGRNTAGKEFNGTLAFKVGSGVSASLTLEGAAGQPVRLDAEKLDRFCRDETGDRLDYLTFDWGGSGRMGQLYYLYDRTGEKAAGTAKYYRSGSPSLSDLTFVPGSATENRVTIPFTGRNTGGKTFSGALMIQYTALREPDAIRYTSDGTAVNLRSGDFAAACAARGGRTLRSVRFSTPNLNGGRLYFDYTGPARYRGTVDANLDYAASGVYPLDKVSFQPKAEFSGTVVIPYMGTDSTGTTYQGVVQITVTPPASAPRFSDMGNYGWAAPGVEFLAHYGITTGTGTGATFSPADQLTRCDYLLMLVRTFGFTAAGTDNFSDVPAGSYYASALATAKALGIAQAEAGNTFRPTAPVTREDAMVFLYRAMQKAGRGISSAQDSFLTRFPDGAAVSAAARPAVAAMAQAGVIKGDQVGRLNPQGTLTRAEMAVILHRGLTL